MGVAADDDDDDDADDNNNNYDVGGLFFFTFQRVYLLNTLCAENRVAETFHALQINVYLLPAGWLAGWPGLSITGMAPAVVVVAVLALQSTYILATGLDMNCRVDSEQGARGKPAGPFGLRLP